MKNENVTNDQPVAAPPRDPAAPPAPSAAGEQPMSDAAPKLTAVAETLLGGPAKAPEEPGAEAPPTEAPPTGSLADAQIIYEPFALPEGATLDDKAVGEATALFRQARLDQATAQKFVDLAMGRDQAALQRSVQAFSDLQDKWAGEVRADPEIGGLRFEPSLAAAARAIDHLAVPGLREALHVTGAGNHPAVVKAFVRLGWMLAEDRFLPSPDAAPATAPQSLAERLYGEKGPKGSVDGL